MQISINMCMPDPGDQQQRQPPDLQRPSVEDQIREALECIDSGHDSHVEWSLVNRLYRSLKALQRPNQRALGLISMIEPVLAHYGYHGVAAGVDNGE